MNPAVICCSICVQIGLNQLTQFTLKCGLQTMLMGKIVYQAAPNRHAQQPALRACGGSLEKAII